MMESKTERLKALGYTEDGIEAIANEKGLEGLSADEVHSLFKQRYPLLSEEEQKAELNKIMARLGIDR